MEVGLGAVNDACDPLKELDNAIDATHGDKERGCIEDVYYCHPPSRDDVRIRLMGSTSKEITYGPFRPALRTLRWNRTTTATNPKNNTTWRIRPACYYFSTLVSEWILRVGTHGESS